MLRKQSQKMRFVGSSASFHAVYNYVIAVTAALLATDNCVQQPYAGKRLLS